MPTVTPGVNFIDRGTVNPQSPPTLTDTAFIAGITSMGRTDAPVLLRSLQDKINNFGPRQPWDTIHDWLDAYWNEGNGGVVYVQRIAPPAGAVDTFTFNDAGAVASISVTSIGPAASGLSAAIVAGLGAGTYNIVVTGLPDGSTITSPDLTTVSDAVQWGATQLLFRVNALGANPPANHAAAALAGGSDGHAGITDTQTIAALGLIPPGLGPGQVIVPGSTSEAVAVALFNHALDNNRYAIHSLIDSSSSSTLIAAAALLRADITLENTALRHGMVVCDWQVIPGITPGTTRTVPPSAIAAALIGRSDRATANPNIAAAGVNGQVQYAVGRTQADWTDVQIQSLVAAGINPFHIVFGSQRLYDFRTMASPSAEPVYVMGTASRLVMAIRARGIAIGQNIMDRQIDGQGTAQGVYAAAVYGMLLEYYNRGALYSDPGKGPDTAFVVDVGADVNTPSEIAARRLHCAVGIRPSPYAETIFFELAAAPANVPLT